MAPLLDSKLGYVQGSPRGKWRGGEREGHFDYSLYGDVPPNRVWFF